MAYRQIAVHGNREQLERLKEILKAHGYTVLKLYPIIEDIQDKKPEELQTLPPAPKLTDTNHLYYDSTKAKRSTLLQAISSGVVLIQAHVKQRPPEVTRLRIVAEAVYMLNGTRDIFHIVAMPLRQFERLLKELPFYKTRNLHTLASHLLDTKYSDWQKKVYGEYQITIHGQFSREQAIAIFNWD